MLTSVYLSNNNIQVVIGSEGRKRVAVNKVYENEITEGSLINGMVINEAELQEELKDFWEKNDLPKNKVSLVINSSQFIIKSLRVPKLSKKKLMSIIPREFADVERSNDPVYDYMILSENTKDKTVEMLATMAERSFVDSFVGIFHNIGVCISSVNTALDCEIKLLNLLPAMQDKTCIVQLLDENNLTSVLWLNGKYTYSSRSRLFYEHGTEDFGVEVARTVSSIMQFHASLKSETTIESVYFGGMDDIDLQYCIQGVDVLGLSGSELISDGVVSMPSDLLADKVFGKYVFPIGELVVLNKDVNLYKNTKKDLQKSEKNSKMIKALIPGAVVLGLCTLTTLSVVVVNMVKQKNLNDLNNYLTNPLNLESMAKSEELELENQVLLSKIASASAMMKAINSYPKMNSKVEASIQACGAGKVEIKIQGYDANTGQLELQAVAAQVTEINIFIKQLKNSKLFNNVEYSGYSFLDGTNIYNINVICNLAEEAGRQE